MQYVVDTGCSVAHPPWRSWVCTHRVFPHLSFVLWVHVTLFLALPPHWSDWWSHNHPYLMGTFESAASSHLRYGFIDMLTFPGSSRPSQTFLLCMPRMHSILLVFLIVLSFFSNAVSLDDPACSLGLKWFQPVAKLQIHNSSPCYPLEVLTCIFCLVNISSFAMWVTMEYFEYSSSKSDVCPSPVSSF